MQLRYYQEEAKEAVFKFFEERPEENPCVVLPTGAGKTPLLASICDDVVSGRRLNTGGTSRVLVVSHVKELLEQSRDRIKDMAPRLDVGVYSAGLSKRDTRNDVIVAGVQSIYNKASQLGSFDLMIVDECHLIPPEGEGRYQTLIKNLRNVNPDLKIVGLTATPYRMKTGTLCSPDGILNAVCYEAGIKRLIEEGYLTQLRSRFVNEEMQTGELHVRLGEFIASEVDQLVNNEWKIRVICKEILEKFASYSRRKCLVFAANVRHAENIKAELEKQTGEECGIVLGDTPSAERAQTLADFKKGAIKYLVNVSVLTTGFDDPAVDMIALIRPTASPGLYYQMCGRGFRIAPDKDFCMILDFGQNIRRHGPVDAIYVKTSKGSSQDAPVKECDKCGFFVLAAVKKCPYCGYVFPKPFPDPDKAIQLFASPEDVISMNFQDRSLYIGSTKYQAIVWENKNAIQATYKKYTSYWYRSHEEEEREKEETIVEILCPEHEGVPRREFAKWWLARSFLSVPDTVEQAMEIIDAGRLASTRQIHLRRKNGEEKEWITAYEIDRKELMADAAPDEKPQDLCPTCCFNKRGWCKKKGLNVTRDASCTKHRTDVEFRRDYWAARDWFLEHGGDDDSDMTEEE